MKAKILFVLLAVFIGTSANAQTDKMKEKALRLAQKVEKSKTKFFGSKNNKPSLTGDGNLLASGYTNHYYINDITLSDDVKSKCSSSKADNKLGETFAAELNKAGVAYQIVDYLFMNDGKSLHEDLLNERAEANVRAADEELAEFDQKNEADKKATLRDNWYPIIDNNYVFLRTGYKGNKPIWYAFKLVTPSDICEVAFSNWENPSALRQLDCHLVFAGCGKGKSINSDYLNNYVHSVSKKVAPLAVYGQITSRTPLLTDIGSAEGVDPMDWMYIYRQKQNKAGVMKSTKIATTRVTTRVTSNEARLYTIGGGFPSRKYGDIAVLHPSTHQASNFIGNYHNKAAGFDYQHEFMTTFSHAGIASYLIMRIGAGYYLPSESKLQDKAEPAMKKVTEWQSSYIANTNYDGYFLDAFNKPFSIDFSIGYGVSWTVAHRLEIMPYVLAQTEMLMATSKEKDYDGYMTLALRTPVGLKLNLNIAYPFQIFAGAEYNFYNFGFNPGPPEKESSSSNSKTAMRFMPFSWWNDGVAKPNHMRRTGLQIYAGLRFNF